MPERIRVKYAKERVTLARVYIAINHWMRDSYMPSLRLDEAHELYWVIWHILIGHVGGCRVTSSWLARVTEMPRVTLLRKLEQLAVLGYVERTGTQFLLTEKVNPPNLRKIFGKHRQLVRNVAAELSKTDAQNGQNISEGIWNKL